jgi:hypothetical protein
MVSAIAKTFGRWRGNGIRPVMGSGAGNASAVLSVEAG